MLPPDSPLLVGGRQYSRTDQDGEARQSYQEEEKKDTVILEPSGYVGAAHHCLPKGCPSGAQTKKAVKPEAETLGEGHLQPLSHIFHFPRKKPERKQDLGTEEKNPKCLHSYTESLWQREHLAALNTGASPLYSTQAS